MQSYTPQTLTAPEALDADLAAGERRGMHIETNQFRTGLAGAAVLVIADRDQERRVALACTVPAAELMASAKMIRNRLIATAQQVAEALKD
jgi:DNA-binding IclR family transcriptional regulator